MAGFTETRSGRAKDIRRGTAAIGANTGASAWIDENARYKSFGDNMTKRLIEYALVVLVAIIVSMLLILVLFPRNQSCDNCPAISLPQERANCDKQFFGSSVRSRTLSPGQEHEYLVSYVENPEDANSSGGYSSPTGGYPGTTPAPSSRPAAREPGFLMVRAQPQIGYDYSGGTSSSSFDISNTPIGQPWSGVTVTVARYATQLRNDEICGQTEVRFREGRYESFCTIPLKFTEDDGGMHSYRYFVRNDSGTPVEYCMISNCDWSTPLGGGSTCKTEQPAQ